MVPDETVTDAQGQVEAEPRYRTFSCRIYAHELDQLHAEARAKGYRVLSDLIRDKLGLEPGPKILQAEVARRLAARLAARREAAG